MPVIKKCLICGKEFRVKPSHAKKRKCCSYDCKFIYLRKVFKEGIRVPPNLTPRPPKRRLIELYINQEIGLMRLQKVFHADYHTIKRWLKQYGIRIRTYKEAIKIRGATPSAFKKGHKVSIELRKKMLKGLCKKPTKPEKKLMELIKENNLPYKYVGNGEVLIGNRNPDFIHKTDKTIIEVFGVTFHSRKSRLKIEKYRTKNETIKYYEKKGYQILILWDLEVLNCPQEKLIQKIKQFTQKSALLLRLCMLE